MRVVPFVCLTVLLGSCGQALPTLAHGKPVRHWVVALQDPDAGVRKKAVGVLGNVGTADPEVIPALTRAVGDRDAAVRREAILALLKIGPPAREAVPALQEAQKDKDPKVRSYAAKALERIQEDH